jgi:pyruvate/2-oxoglutarate dehydrogenase complex dihydrolipoamide acyltransferase (E2) component
MMIKVPLPELGENITKATVSYWYVEEGARVTEGSDLVEMATDKAAFNVPAPCSGVVLKILVHEGDSVNVGDVLAVLEVDTVIEEKADE